MGREKKTSDRNAERKTYPVTVELNSSFSLFHFVLFCFVLTHSGIFLDNLRRGDDLAFDTSNCSAKNHRASEW